MKRKFNSILKLVAAVALLSGFPASQQQDCIPDGRIRPGDGIDNDCDGLIDEEYCYNGIDEDQDGKLNEDCAALPVCERRGWSAGLEFVGTFMENRPDRWVYTPLEMIITRYPKTQPRSAISASVQTPLLFSDANNDDAAAQRTNLSASIGASDSATKIFLPDVLRVIGARIAHNGFYVRTNSTASVHAYNKEFYTSDSFLQLPADSLGTDYYAITYETSWLYTEMAIVALYSDTVVTIQLLADTGDTDIPRIEMEWDGKTYTNGDRIRIRLQPFEVAQFQSEYDLTGTHVTSNLPIAFYSGNVRTWIRDDVTETDVQSRDHLVEQIPPTDTWGTRFVTQNYPPHKGEDRVHVVASQDDTVVEYTMTPSSDGSNGEETQRFSLVRAGTSYHIRLKPNTRISLIGSKPIMVIQLTHSQIASDVPANEFTDPSLIYVAPVNQFDNDYFFGTSDYVGEGNFTTFVVMTTKEGSEGSITLDGQPLSYLAEPPRWRPISIRGSQADGEPRTLRYVQGYIKVADGVHRVKTNSQDDTFSAVVWAVGDRNSYAHPLGIRWKKGDCIRCKQVYCGDHVDNDCDGRIDEELCDGTDDDGDGLIDEDCYSDEYCRFGRKRTTTTTTTTTTTPRTATTESIAPPPGLCLLPPARCAQPATKVNLIFVLDWTTARTPTSNQFNLTSQFLQQAISAWFPDTPAKFGVVSFANGVTNFLQYLTSNRGTAIANIKRSYRVEMITNTNSDLTSLLRFVRSHMFTAAANADDDAKKIVVVLAMAPYTTPSAVKSVRWEATRLMSDYNATTQFIGLSTYRDDIAQMALADRFVTNVDAFMALASVAEPDSDFVRGLGVRDATQQSGACNSDIKFQKLQICYGSQATLTCPSNYEIVLMSANFGRVNYYSENSCGYANPLACDAANPACPYLDVYEQITASCNFRQSCTLTLGANLISKQAIRLLSSCTLQATYLDVSYICADLTPSSACSFTPASRFLRPTNEFSLTASSFASCPSCHGPSFGNTGPRGRYQDDAVQPQCDTSNFCPSFSDQCRPSLATFDHSALEAWCPSLSDKASPWLTADLGAPYVVLGVVLQGRRRFMSQYVNEVAVYVSEDNYDFLPVMTQTPKTTFAANNNSTQITWIYFQTSENIVRYVKIQVLTAAEHPALHLEVIIHNRVNGCESFRGANTNLDGKRGTMGVDTVVHCLGDTRTDDGSAAYTTRCKKDYTWSVEKSCQ